MTADFDPASSTNINRNGDADLNAGRDITIGGDIVGHDKISSSTTIFTGDQQYDVRGLTNLGQNEQVAVALDDDLRTTKKDGWRGNKIKEREVRYVNHKHMQDDAEADRIFELVKNQVEY